MKIRNFIKEDLLIYQNMAHAFYKSDATLEEISEVSFTHTFEEIMKGSPYIRGLMLHDESKYIGYALLTFTWSCECDGILVTIDELFIDAKYRGKGYGSKFFEWLEKEYSINDYTYVLEVNPKNPKAKQLYERLGYQTEEYISMYKE